ncbi:alpha/beta hydrolase [Nocardia sp. NPDC056064]|uniref:alpha/beta hydrolase n=1 Tax=Nocardia sp. NPDC056064 TaxID=3345701 RepID=UPI0035DFD27D
MQRRSIRRIVAAALCAVTVSFVSGTAAFAVPATAPGVDITAATAPDGSYIERIEVTDARHLRLYVHSAAMDKTFPVDVQRPADTSAPKPALYLLNGAGGGMDRASWQLRTDALDFLADKDVNVVQIIGGAWSFYTDWEKPDPVLGVNKWQTYIGEELPPLIDAALGTNGVNAIAGLSMSGVPVLNLAIAHPGLFRSAAVYSGLTQVSDLAGRQAVKMTVEMYGGGDVRNMWGPLDGPGWPANDPLVNAEKLRGTHLFVSTGNGIPGIHDQPGGPFRMEKPADTPKTVALGALIEGAVWLSAQNLRARLDQLGIPGTFVFRDSGTHSWGYWQDDFKASWPVLAEGLFPRE